MLSFVSVAVNCAIIFYTSNALDYILLENKQSQFYQFMILVMIEHIIIGFKLFVSIVIRDKPAWVSTQEQELQEQEELVRTMIDSKKVEAKEAGTLLEDQIAAAKKIKF